MLYYTSILKGDIMSCPVNVKFYKNAELIAELPGNLGWIPNWTFKRVLDNLEEMILMARKSIPEANDMPLPSELDWDEIEILNERKSITDI